MDASFKNSSTQVYESRPKDFSRKVEVVACYLKCNGKVLLLQNSGAKPEPGRWGVPAGKLEPSETLEVAAQRELFEETGIVAPICFLTTLYLRKPGFDYVYHMFQVLVEKEESVFLSYEHTKYLWIAQSQIKDLDLMQGAGEALRKYYTLKQRESS